MAGAHPANCTVILMVMQCGTAASAPELPAQGVLLFFFFRGMQKPSSGKQLLCSFILGTGNDPLVLMPDIILRNLSFIGFFPQGEHRRRVIFLHQCVPHIFFIG